MPVSTHHTFCCERCGAVLDVEWIDITALGDAEPQFIPGRSTCPTAGCGTTCPICHRPPGDIHSGACAPIVLAKATDQVRVTREDCLAVVHRAGCA
jgi:hypothetical protein